MKEKTVGPFLTARWIMVLLFLLCSGPLQAADYRSLYSYDHTVSYCSQHPCAGAANCEADRYPCKGSYKYTDTLHGFRATFDLHDARIACGEDIADASGCISDEEGLSLSLGTLHQTGLDYISAFSEGFRIFVPPGTVDGYVNIYMPIDGVEGVVVRFQQPPTFQGEYDNVPGWDLPNRVNMNTMKQRDVFLDNRGGLAQALVPFSLSTPLGEADSGWLYIRKLPKTSSRIHKVSISFRVNVGGYLAWYDRVLWDENGDPRDIGSGCTADDLGRCDSEEKCVGSGFYWYQGVSGGYSCHVEPRCRPDNLSGCETAGECEGIEAYWYDEVCNADPACTSEDLVACENQSECTGSGFYWYRENGEETESCHQEPRCRPDNLGGCENFDECRGIEAYWYDQVCNADPACTADDLSGCDNEEKCTGSGFYWYLESGEEVESCHQEPLCRSDNPGGCQTENECEGIEAYWYDEVCNADPACTAADLSGCDNEEKCAGAGFYWYNNTCAASPACTPSNLSDCANRIDCQANGGEWHTDGHCVAPAAAGGSSSGSSGSSSGSRTSGLGALLGHFGQSAPVCDPDHLDLCHSQLVCESSGHGYWYDGLCHADPKQMVVDYLHQIPQAPVRLGGDANDGVLSAGESFALQMDFPDSEAFTRYILIVLPGGDYFFVQNSVEQPFASLGQVVPYGGASHATLFEMQNFCSVMPDYVGDWWVLALRVPAKENVFPDMDSMLTYLNSGGQYILDYYTVHIDCSGYVPPSCTADDLGNCDTLEKCQESGFYWYDDGAGEALCHARPHCRLDNLGGCQTAGECAGIDGYWYDNACHVAAACNGSDLSACDTEEKCTSAGFSWDNGACSAGTGCSSANLSACTNSYDCYKSGGSWYSVSGGEYCSQ
jgi:hypothetical protein